MSSNSMEKEKVGEVQIGKAAAQPAPALVTDVKEIPKEDADASKKAEENAKETPHLVEKK